MVDTSCTNHVITCDDLKHSHNVEKRFYCPQTFLSLDFSVEMMFLN